MANAELLSKLEDVADQVSSIDGRDSSQILRFSIWSLCDSTSSKKQSKTYSSLDEY